ncbi:MAG: cellulase family glycosylhydrolase [Salinarimonas sp.]|nr:cellulase family glycosylhydrolase [Salinarimonas sp.]
MPAAPRDVSRRTALGLIAGAAAFAAAPAAVDALPVRAVPLLRRGVNLFPWFSLTREYPAPRTDYPWPPFQPDRPIPRIGDLMRLRRAGIDFVRLPIDPGPFLGNAGAHRPQLLREVANAVDEILFSGLTPVVNLHVNTATHHWNAQTLTARADTHGFKLYMDFVAELAGLLADRRYSGTVLEPANEPPHGCSSAEWRRMQDILLTAAASAAPGLPLVATGACGGMIAGLEELSPIKTSSPLFYTVHFYEPYLFTHQGAKWMGDRMYHYIEDVPWPASAGRLKRTLAATRRRLEADARLGATEREQIFAHARDALSVYFEVSPDRWYVDRYLDRVVTWSDANGVPARHIILGEFGAIRPSSISSADRADYVRDVRRSAEERGLPWAFWNLFDSMGMMHDDTRAFDPIMIDALGLTAT